MMNHSPSTNAPIICEPSPSGWRMWWAQRIGPHIPKSAEIMTWVREHQLTDEERAVFDLLAERRSAAEIAARLEMDPRAVARCIDRIHARIDAAMPSKTAV